MQSISLSELTTQIQFTLRDYFSEAVWVRAEISEYREHPNGHCYLELIEKDPKSDNLTAKVKANIWNNTLRMLKPYFEQTTGQKLKAGLNVLVAVTVEFHGVYGLSLNIKDIDPKFTMGDLAARKLQIIKQLEDEGVIDMNRELEFPALPQRIAIISSPTAAGYDDFCNQLFNDENHFAFYIKLFPAIMQGDQAELSIIGALDRIYNYIDLFDAVVMIRGGGATTDLACFDTYDLAAHCAQFPLPIIAGIGHQRDNTIVDRVAYQSVKTPTAAAEFLIARMIEVETELTDIYSDIQQNLQRKIQKENNRLADARWRLKHALQNKTLNRRNLLERQKMRLHSALNNIQHKQKSKLLLLDRFQIQIQNRVRMIIQVQNNKLSLMERSIETHSPAFLLKHGYTITTLHGKRLTSAKEAKKGDQIRTWLHDGEITSTIDQ